MVSNIRKSPGNTSGSTSSSNGSKCRMQCTFGGLLRDKQSPKNQILVEERKEMTKARKYPARERMSEIYSLLSSMRIASRFFFFHLVLLERVRRPPVDEYRSHNVCSERKERKREEK